jgi:hypothetical protein
LKADQKLTYWNPEPLSREQALVDLKTGDPEQIGRVLIRLAYHDPDWRWVYETCAPFASHADANVRGNAACCLGLLAVFHQDPETAVAVPILEKLHTDADPLVRGMAESALDDVNHLIKRKGQS